MKRSGIADLPLHGGKVPAWLYRRMARLGSAIVETIILEYGHSEVLKRLSDPFWFQSFGAVLGMDWHSSGITTSVMGALKGAINQRSASLGLYICGGRGLQSRATPTELHRICEATGMPGDHLIRCSKLSAKVDNTAIQDGFQLYLHNFVLASNGEWSVVQQGMRGDLGLARRYHWHSNQIESFTDEPHTSIFGVNVGEILNLVASEAEVSRQGVLDILDEKPAHLLSELPYLKLPSHHEVQSKDIDIKRLGAMLYQAQDTSVDDFEELLLLKGMGPRTLQSLALVSEVIYGTPSRFSDPARFSFAHGGKDGHPFPVPLNTYDETIDFLDRIVSNSKLDRTDKVLAGKKLHEISIIREENFIPDATKFNQFLIDQKHEAMRQGGRTVFDDRRKVNPKRQLQNNQLQLF